MTFLNNVFAEVARSNPNGVAHAPQDQNRFVNYYNHFNLSLLSFSQDLMQLHRAVDSDNFTCETSPFIRRIQNYIMPKFYAYKDEYDLTDDVLRFFLLSPALKLLSIIEVAQATYHLAVGFGIKYGLFNQDQACMQAHFKEASQGILNAGLFIMLSYTNNLFIFLNIAQRALMTMFRGGFVNSETEDAAPRFSTGNQTKAVPTFFSASVQEAKKVVFPETTSGHRFAPA